MTKTAMHQFNCTTLASAIFASASGWLSAVWAGLVTAIREVFAMNVTMTGNTNGLTVLNIKSKVGMLGPFFNMVSVNLSCIAAYLAGVIITSVNSFAPFGQFIRQARPFIFQRSTIFPCGGVRPNVVKTSVFSAAFFRASISGVMICREVFTAYWASFSTWRMAIGPTFFRAIFRRVMSVCWWIESFTTDKAFFRLASVFSHDHRIPQTGVVCNGNKYCEVILRRAEAAGLTVRLDNG